MPGWLFRRFILRRVIQNPIRLVLLLSAVAIATTLLSSVARVSFAGVQSFEESLGYSTETYPLIVTPRGGRIALEELGACLTQLGSSFDLLAYRREAGVLTTSQGNRALSVVGMTGAGEGDNAGVSEDRVLFSKRALSELGLTEGIPIHMSVGNVSIDGKATINANEIQSIPGVTAIVPLSQLAEAEGPSVVDAILLRPHVGNDPTVYRESLQQWITNCSAISVPLHVDTAATRMQRGESLVAAYRFNVAIMAAMTLLVCALLVSQATQLSLRALSRELSILQTLGLGRGACLVSVVREAACIAIAGAVLGVTVGEPVTLRITELFLQTAHDIYNLSLATAGSYHLAQRVGIVITMVLICVLGAGLGGIEALRISPSLGTRTLYRHAQPISARWARRIAVFGVVGWLLIGLVAHATDSVVFAYLFVAASIAATIAVTPYVIVLAPRLLAACGEFLFVWFARGGVSTGGRGFILGATGVSVGMALICALSIMVGSFRQTLDQWAAQRLAGDIFVSAALEGEGNETRLSPLLIPHIESVEGIKRVIPYYETMTSYQGAPLMMSASNISAQLERGIYVLRAGSLEREALVSGRGAMASESAARKLGLRVGDAITVDGRSVKVVAVIQEFGTEHPLLQVDESLFLSMYPEHHPENVTIILDATPSAQNARNTIEKIVGSVGVVRDNRELRELVLTLFDRTFRVTLSVRWIVFSIALLGLMLASLQLLWERRREIKTMHLLGFSPREIVGAHVVESGVVCGLPVLIGLLGGIGLGWGLTTMVNPRSFGWSLDFSLSIAPVFIALAFIISVVLAVGIATRLFLRRVLKEATLSDE